VPSLPYAHSAHLGIHGTNLIEKSLNHPNGKPFRAPINEKMLMVINLLTDPMFKEHGEPPLTMFFSCARCGWYCIKPEGVPLQELFTE